MIKIDRESVGPDCMFPETWFRDAERLRDEVESRIRWHELIKATILWQTGNRHVLTFTTRNRGELYGASCDLTHWVRFKDPRLITAALDRIIRAAMYEVKQ